MAKKIKKLSKKFIALICMITLVFTASVTVNKSEAAGVTATAVSDALADSRPGVAPEIVPNHTIKFKYENAGSIVNTNTQTFTFTGFTHGAGTTAVTDFAITAGADGVTYGTSLTQTTDFTFGNSGGANPVFTFTWTGTGATKLNTNSYVKIVYTNATTKLPNPAAGVYTITLGGSGNWATGRTQVAIVSGVSVSATVGEVLAFTISDTAVGFGTIIPGTARYANSDETGEASAPVADGDPLLLTLTSNTSGATISIKSINSNSTAGLYSTSTTQTLTAAASTTVAGAPSSSGFGVYGADVAGITLDEGFDHDSTSDLAVTTSNLPFAASSTGGDDTVEVEMVAAAAATVTSASDFATTVVFTATPVY